MSVLLSFVAIRSKDHAVSVIGTYPCKGDWNDWKVSWFSRRLP
jgi:hypothetical protein